MLLRRGVPRVAQNWPLSACVAGASKHHAQRIIPAIHRMAAAQSFSHSDGDGPGQDHPGIALTGTDYQKIGTFLVLSIMDLEQSVRGRAPWASLGMCGRADGRCPCGCSHPQAGPNASSELTQRDPGKIATILTVIPT